MSDETRCFECAKKLGSGLLNTPDGNKCGKCDHEQLCEDCFELRRSEESKSFLEGTKTWCRTCEEMTEFDSM